MEKIEYKPFGDTYGPLNVGKIGYHSKRIQPVLDGNCYDGVPVTVHLVPTMRCTHRCYFCTYGGAKERNSHSQSRQFDMPLDEMLNIIRQMSEHGIKGIIFTGGGEPTLYRELPEAMAACRDANIDFSLNTNGSGLTPEFIRKVMRLEPTYLRVSLNAGSAEVQHLITGVDDFEKVLKKIEILMREKILAKVRTTISVAFAVEILNLYDIKKLVDRLIDIEARVRRDTGEKCQLVIVVRPVSNYENSKHYNEKRIQDIVRHLSKRGNGDEQDFLRFMNETHQITAKHLDIATEIIENEIRPMLAKTDTGVSLFYPSRKFADLPRVKEKPYARCYVLSWFMFIWPDGTVYPCIEWAGTPGFEIGNLRKQSLSEILNGSRRSEIIEWINNSVLHTRCAPICAHHETNCLLARIADSANTSDRTDFINTVRILAEQSKPWDVNFL